MAVPILDEAQSKYGFLKNLGLQVKINPRPDSNAYAETWRVDEPGSADVPRPTDIPINVTGVEIFKPDEFTADDLAGEGLHVDKVARQTADLIQQTLSQDQAEKIATNASDYEASIQSGMDPEDAMRNAVDSMIRGYVVGQWPKEAIDSIGLDAEQRELLQKLKDYAISGKSESEQERDGFESSFRTSGQR